MADGSDSGETFHLTGALNDLWMLDLQVRTGPGVRGGGNSRLQTPTRVLTVTMTVTLSMTLCDPDLTPTCACACALARARARARAWTWALDLGLGLLVRGTPACRRACGRSVRRMAQRPRRGAARVSSC